MLISAYQPVLIYETKEVIVSYNILIAEKQVQNEPRNRKRNLILRVLIIIRELMEYFIYSMLFS